MSELSSHERTTTTTTTTTTHHRNVGGDVKRSAQEDVELDRLCRDCHARISRCVVLGGGIKRRDEERLAKRRLKSRRKTRHGRTNKHTREDVSRRRARRQWINSALIHSDAEAYSVCVSGIGAPRSPPPSPRRRLHPFIHTTRDKRSFLRDGGRTGPPLSSSPVAA